MSKSIEERIARLERELTFLKAQGLSRDEQDSLLGSGSMDRQPRRGRWLLWFCIAQSIVVFVLFGLLILQNQNNDFQNNKRRGVSVDQGLDALPPPKGQPFVLPSAKALP